MEAIVAALLAAGVGAAIWFGSRGRSKKKSEPVETPTPDLVEPDTVMHDGTVVTHDFQSVLRKGDDRA